MAQHQSTISRSFQSTGSQFLAEIGSSGWQHGHFEAVDNLDDVLNIRLLVGGHGLVVVVVVVVGKVGVVGSLLEFNRNIIIIIIDRRSVDSHLIQGKLLFKSLDVVLDDAANTIGLESVEETTKLLQ